MKIAKGLLTLFVFFSCRLFAQTADEIISNHTKAVGGLENWKKVQTMKARGVINQNGTEIELEMLVEHNKGARQTISFAGLQGYSIFTPAAGWNFYPWQGHQKPEAITPDAVKEQQDNMDVQTPIVDYKAKGHTAEYVGKDEFEGTECYKVKLTQKSGKVVTYYIDPSNYFIIHSITVTKANGLETENKSSYSNYQKLPEGVWMPMQVDNVKIKTVQLNVPLADDSFKPSNN